MLGMRVFKKSKSLAAVAICTIALMAVFSGTAWANDAAPNALSAGGAIAQSADEPTLSAPDVSAEAGETFKLDVNLSSNPGIIGATLKVTYDSRLTLTGITNGPAFKALDMTKPGELKSGCKIHWDAMDLADGDVMDGTIVTLTFALSKNAMPGEVCSINVAADSVNGNPDVYDRNLETVGLRAAQCKVAVARTSLSSAAISGLKSLAYTGKALTPNLTVKMGTKTLKKGTDYTLSYKNNKVVGTATVTATGTGAYTGTKSATFKITKAANTAAAKSTNVSKTVKAAALKKAAQTIALPKVTTKFGTAKWAITTKDAKKVLSLSGSSVKVKKGAKAGTYTIKLKASVSGTKNYAAASTKVVTVKATVK